MRSSHRRRRSLISDHVPWCAIPSQNSSRLLEGDQQLERRQSSLIVRRDRLRTRMFGVSSSLPNRIVRWRRKSRPTPGYAADLLEVPGGPSRVTFDFAGECNSRFAAGFLSAWYKIVSGKHCLFTNRLLLS